MIYYVHYNTRTQRTMQVPAVLLTTCQWTWSAIGSLTVECPGSMQATTVYLVVDHWLFSPALDVRGITHNWQTGWISLVQTRLTGSDW